MPLPHLQQKNNVDLEPFVSVEDEMKRTNSETHAASAPENSFLPAHVTPNPELDAKPENDDEESPSAD